MVTAYASGFLLLYQDWAPLILRLVLGAALIAHGYPKLFKNFAMVSGWFDSIGIRPGRFWALVVGVVEFFGGTLLVLGVFVELAALLIAVDMLVAMIKVKWGKSPYLQMQEMGWEFELAYFAMALALVLLGGGAYALDQVLF